MPALSGGFNPRHAAPFRPFLLFSALAIWMYYTVAHVPGGQPIGALERVAAKAGQKIRAMLTMFQRKPRTVESLT